MSGFESKRLIVVMGPTAVGKTSVAIQLAKKLKAEIISADSRQLFKEMTIGTAMPTNEELAEVKHHFIGNLSVETPYDAGKYGEDANAMIHELFKVYDNLILCGGSGMYIKAILEGFDEMPPIPEGVRKQIINEFNLNGLSWLQDKVAAGDPDYFRIVDQKNPQRLMRALELMRVTGQPASTFRKNERKIHSFEVVKLGLELEKEALYEKINTRVDKMLEAGLLDEVKGLYSRKSINALQTVGYQELFGYLDGEYDYKEAIRLLKRNTRRYAKRQLTWFKKDDDVKWFKLRETENILTNIIQHLNDRNR